MIVSVSCKICNVSYNAYFTGDNADSEFDYDRVKSIFDGDRFKSYQVRNFLLEALLDLGFLDKG